MKYEDAPPWLQLMMRRHDVKTWRKTPSGEVQIGFLVKGSYDFKTITSEMREAAQGQVDTGTPAYRGELDFAEPSRPRRPPGKRRGASGR
jgi:hypothetical protein